MTLPARSPRRPGWCRVGALGAALAGVALAGCVSGPTAQFNGATPSTSHLLHGSTNELTTHEVSGLGTVVVDGQGLTLYVYEPDHDKGVSTCYDICSTEWPPLVLNGASAPTAGPGIDAALMGTTKRDDGTVEVTYAGWPLYLWPPDGAPGQATGQAINNAGGYWYVIRPNGQVVTTRVP